MGLSRDFRINQVSALATLENEAEPEAMELSPISEGAGEVEEEDEEVEEENEEVVMKASDHEGYGDSSSKVSSAKRTTFRVKYHRRS